MKTERETNRERLLTLGNKGVAGVEGGVGGWGNWVLKGHMMLYATGESLNSVSETNTTYVN